MLARVPNLIGAVARLGGLDEQFGQFFLLGRVLSAFDAGQYDGFSFDTS